MFNPPSHISINQPFLFQNQIDLPESNLPDAFFQAERLQEHLPQPQPILIPRTSNETPDMRSHLPFYPYFSPLSYQNQEAMPSGPQLVPPQTYNQFYIPPAYNSNNLPISPTLLPQPEMINPLMVLGHNAVLIGRNPLTNVIFATPLEGNIHNLPTHPNDIDSTLFYCRFCGVSSITDVTREPSQGTWNFCLTLSAFCLLPCGFGTFCSKRFRNTIHTCPNCKQRVGTRVFRFCS